MTTLNLVAYHDIIATADDVKKKFAELNRDNYPTQVYQFVLDYHTDTQGPILDVLAWCCDLAYTPVESEYFAELDEKTVVICTDDNGAWHMSY